MVLPADPPPPAGAGTMTLRHSTRNGAVARGRLSDALNRIDQAEQKLARARGTNHDAGSATRRTPAPPRS
jgi:hypothetical protein